MQHVILGLLVLFGPQSLYDLHKHFSQGISLFYSASFGSLQRALQQLVAQGLATSTEAAGRRGRKLHTITDAGRDAWRTWMLAPIVGGDAETTMLAKVFLAGVLTDPADREAVVAALRARVASDLADLRGAAAAIDGQIADVAAEHADVFTYQRATLDYGIRAHALAADWLDELAAGALPRPAAGALPRVRG